MDMRANGQPASCRKSICMSQKRLVQAYLRHVICCQMVGKALSNPSGSAHLHVRTQHWSVARSIIRLLLRRYNLGDPPLIVIVVESEMTTPIREPRDSQLQKRNAVSVLPRVT